MNLLLEKKHSAAVEEFRECIALLEQEKNQAKDEDVSLIHSTLDTTISTLYCNIAIAQRDMGLHRQSIKSCALAIKHDPTNIKCYLIEGETYLSIGKLGHAQATWQEGVDNITNYCDAGTALQLIGCIASLKKKKDEKGKIVTPDCNVKLDAVETDTQACSRSQSSSSNKSMSVEVPCIEKQEGPSDHSKGAADAIAALGGKRRNVGIEQLKIIENHFIGYHSNQIHPEIIKVASKSVANACRESTVDNLISMGYLLVNNNKLVEACELFSTLLQYRKDLLAAYLGLGSCWALLGRMEDAVGAFSSAIELDPKCADSWKRRGQTLAALNHVDEGLSDLQRALSIGQDIDLYFQIGSVLHQKKHFKAALDAFHTYLLNGGEKSGKLLNFLGMCHSQLGDVDQALQYFDQAISADPELIESVINRAQMLKEAGRGVDADMAFENVMRWFSRANIAISDENSSDARVINISRQVFHNRASLQYCLGNYMEALGYLRRYLGDDYTTVDDKLKPEDRVSALVQTALCLQNIGQYSEALSYFDVALRINPNSTCRVQKYLLIYYLQHVDSGWEEFSVDRDFNAKWKEAFCKHNSLMPLHEEPFVVKNEIAANIEDVIEELDQSYTVEPELDKVLRICRGLSHWIQLDTPGFLPNSRQHKTFGLAALHMAQKLSQHCNLIVQHHSFASASDFRSVCGLEVLNYGASGQHDDKLGEKATHLFTYRDFFDIAVKWRQISEPNDPVWWIDRLTKESFEEGFGLHTPLVNGELKCIRYYPYFDMGFALLKKILIQDEGIYYIARGDQHLTLPSSKKNDVADACTLDDIYKIVGEDFWVVCPCLSSIHNKVLLEGTRLTLCRKMSDGERAAGYDFSIRTPGLPNRWEAMDAEMTNCFNAVVEQLVALKKLGKADNCCKNIFGEKQSALSQLIKESLRLFYYWANFAPLSRGSAMCGYAAFMAIVLASNRIIKNSIPKGKQLDWEAIFTSNSCDFISRFEDSFLFEEADFSLDEDVDFEKVMPTLYDALHILNLAL